MLCAAVATSGCNEPSIQVLTTVETFVQSPFEKVDVLLVVDNSGSMGPYQTKLGEDFGGFFEFFAEGAVDWRLAVAHTDARAEDYGSIRGPIVTAEAANPAEQFAEVVNVGTDGGGIEAGLGAARKLLEAKRNGFPRDDASVSVIFVSDEEDASPGPIPEYVNAFFDLRGHRQREAFNASALTVTERADCDAEQYQQSALGTRYVETARLTGGISANLCVDDFAQIVRDLALTTSTMIDTFVLQRKPALSSLLVIVDGVEVPCDDGQWRYDLVTRDGVDKPAIVFAPGQLPLPDADVVVEYRPGGGDPADFCPEATP